MNFTDFTNEIEEIIEERLPECEVVLRSIVKNNNVILSGITIKDEAINAAPTIYLEQFYESFQDGETLESISDKILNIYDSNKLKQDYDFEFIENYESAKNNLYFKAVNHDKNKEFLEEIPYFEFEDLALVPYILIDDEIFWSASLVIHRNLFERWCIDENTLYYDIMQNMEQNFEYDFMPITDVLAEMTNCILPDEDYGIGMYVLSPKTKLYGAALIAIDSVLEKIAAELDSDFYIIPSSVHELIIVKSHDKDMAESLNEMINEVNETVVSCEDILSDHAYFYERGWGITQ